MLGYSEKELLQLGVADIHPKGSQDYVMSEFNYLVHGKKPMSSKLPCLRKDGGVFYADIAGSSICIQGRRCIVGFFADVTMREKAGQ